MIDRQNDLEFLCKIFEKINISIIGVNGLTDEEFKKCHPSIKNTSQNREAIFRAKKILTN